MKKLLLILSLLAHTAYSQIFTFTVTDGNEPIPGAILFLQLEGKAFTGATDADGKAMIALKVDTRYKIRVSAVGFEKLEQEIVTNKKEFKVTLKVTSNQLSEVSVTAKRPLITRDGDKDIVDPEPLVQSSTNLMEVLQKTPGLFADSDGNIYLTSTTPAKIYINGREQRMAGSDLATLLRSLPPNSVEKIEVIRTPSASMDASSTGGSINIILRKGTSLFGSGSISAGMNQGKLGNRFFNASYNKTKGRTSFNITGGLNWFDNINNLSSERLLTSTAKLVNDSKINSYNYSKFLRYSVTREINKRLEITYDGRISDRNFSTNNTTLTTSRTNSNILFSNENHIEGSGNSLNINQNVGATLKFDSTGSRRLKIDFSADFFRPHSGQSYSNILQETLSGEGKGTNKSASSFSTLETEFHWPFKNKTKIEAGGKIAAQKYESNAHFTRTQDGQTNTDYFRTNRFNYSSRISALYLMGSKSWGKTSLKGGVRMENTYMAGHQIIPADTTFKIQRTDFFPYIYLGRPIGKIAGWEMLAYLVARRTISRPEYNELNPFRQYVNEYTYQSGNPALRPQFTNNYEFNINVGGYPIFLLGQNYIQDIFTSVIYQDPNNPTITNRTFDNLSKKRETYFRMVGALPPGGKYFFVAGAQYSMNDYSGQYDGLPVNFRRGSWRFFTFHELKLDTKSTLSGSAYYLTKGQMQFTELSNFGSIDLSINRRFFNDRLAITLNASDILFTNKFRYRINQESMIANGFQYSDSRRYGINIRYNFGRRKKAQSSFSLDDPTQGSTIE